MAMRGWFELWRRRRRSRLVLLELSDAQLRDIGLSRSEIDWKIERPLGIDFIKPL
ncbi:DUF1127 domain-containing protein [Terrarubrum flagellatum]|uniref:DUF1127 domain-containing protein n=1 Tax=Terrirubrum flagellatum TaxID=2895980 RepID=UPI00314534CF